MASPRSGAGLALLVISIITAGCGSGGNDEEMSTVEPERISVGELKNLIDNQADVVVVDVRSRESYDKGHIPGAVSMPYPDEIRSRNQELPRDRMIILYCS